MLLLSGSGIWDSGTALGLFFGILPSESCVWCKTSVIPGILPQNSRGESGKFDFFGILPSESCAWCKTSVIPGLFPQKSRGESGKFERERLIH